YLTSAAVSVLHAFCAVRASGSRSAIVNAGSRTADVAARPSAVPGWPVAIADADADTAIAAGTCDRGDKKAGEKQDAPAPGTWTHGLSPRRQWHRNSITAGISGARRRRR